MNLFCFASRSLDNIYRGVAARKWAVATVSSSATRGRVKHLLASRYGIVPSSNTEPLGKR
jgi:hypothetical protein